MGKVLLTDGLQRKTLSAARALGKENIKIVSCETIRINPTRLSKYNDKFFKCFDPSVNPDEYIENIIRNIQTANCDVLIPMDDKSMEISVKNKKNLEQYCFMAIPDEENFYRVYDKANSIKLAQKANVNVPKTIFVEDLLILDKIINTLEFPIIIKPRNSSGSRGIKVIKNIENFKSAYLEVHNKYPFPLIQEYIESAYKFDVCMIYNKQNKVKSTFVQKELRHFPIEIGPSTVQESVYFDEVKDIALKIMDEINWVGVIELEFLINRKNNNIYFMEINPRFWASLELSIISGINFPKMYYDIAITGDCKDKEFYTVGKRVRNLLPGDILHYLYRKDKLKLIPRFWFPGKSVKDDVFRFNDPLPFFVTIIVAIYYFINKNKRKNFLNRN